MYQICIIYIEYCSLIRFFCIYTAAMHLLPSVFNRGFLTSYALKAINFSKTLEISIAFMYDYFIWRRTEEAITGLTRNQFIGAILIRGFESLRLRYTTFLLCLSRICKSFLHLSLFYSTCTLLLTPSLPRFLVTTSFRSILSFNSETCEITPTRRLPSVR